MVETKDILEISKPGFTVRVNETLLKVDLKGSVRNELEEALENKPILKQTLGTLLSMFAPLHVRLQDIASVQTESDGAVRLKIPRHRDVVLHLTSEEAKRLTDVLEERIPEAKEREAEKILKKKKIKKTESAEHDLMKERMMPGLGGAQFPTTEPPGVMKKEEEAAEEQEKQS